MERLGVEDEEALADVEVVGLEGIEHVGEDFGLGEDEADFGDFNRVVKFMACV